MSNFAEYVFKSPKMTLFWVLVRVYVGFLWLEAGWGKISNPAWVGDGAGTAVGGFVAGALKKTVGEHPDVSGWYAFFLEKIVQPNAEIFSYLVAYGELLVGLALIFGICVGLAAFFGALMNMAYLLAGTVSINPQMLILQIGLMLALVSASKVSIRSILPGSMRRNN